MASALETFLTKARRRQMRHAILEQLSIAACAAMIGVLLLLLAGTQILDWYWPVALFVLSFGLGLARLRGRIPSLYRLAQRIDARLGLHDTLSTAYHFLGCRTRIATGFQHAAAERAAENVEMARAVPTPMPRSSYALAGLLAIAATLFATRYLVTHSLDLKGPIAEINLQFFQEPKVHAENRKSAIQERFEEQMKQMGLSVDPVDDHPGGELPPESSDAAAATPDSRAPVEAKDRATGGEGKQSDESGEAPEANEKAQNSQGGDSKDADANSLPGLSVNKQQPNQQNAQKNPSANSGQSSSMLDKMRDAMANLMAKLKLQNNAGKEGQQQASNQGQPSQGQQQSQGSQSQNKSNAQGKPSGEAQGQQSEEGSEQAQAGGNKPGDRNSDQPGGEDSKSGMGKQDGDKSIQDAEQVAAMGKISEILGKRSAQIQGEMTVEVPSGKQQLKTAYSKRRATHADTGAELGREEIPLNLQPYVQRYFDEIRKTPPAVRPPEAPKTRT